MILNEFFSRAGAKAAVISIMSIALSASACAQSPILPAQGEKAPVPGMVERYPSGSILSLEAADTALTEMDKERKRVDAQYAQEQKDCYQKFFTTRCLDKAKEEHRAAIAQLRSIEVEANAFKRKARVAERDRVLEERRKQDETDTKQRSQTVNTAPHPNAGKSIME